MRTASFADMKPVLLVVTKAGLGGAQRSVLELAREMTSRGRTVTVASGEEGWLLAEVRDLGIRTHVFRHLKRSVNPFNALRFLGECYRLFRSFPESPIVHLNSSNTLPAALAGKVAGARVIFTARGLSMLDEGYAIGMFLRSVYWAWFRVWLTFVDVVVCVSTRNAQRLEKLRLGRGKTAVIPNGLNPAGLRFASRETAREELGIQDEEFAVLLLGRLEYAKRQHVLVEAWPTVLERVPNARLILIGDGPDESRLRVLVEEGGLDGIVRFAGPIPNASRLIPAADLLVLPSRYEGWPVVLLEALNAGAAIAAADVGGIAEQLGDAGMVLPDKADASHWASQIVRLSADQELRAALASRARERAKLWVASRMIDAYLDAYRD